MILFKITSKLILSIVSIIVMAQTIAYAETTPIYGFEDRLRNKWAVHVEQKFANDLFANRDPLVGFPGSLRFTKNGRYEFPSKEVLRLLLLRIGSKYDDFQSFYCQSQLFMMMISFIELTA